MVKLSFVKCLVLPTNGAPNTFYFVLDDANNVANMYLTSDAGAYTKVGNTQMVNDLIAQGHGGASYSGVFNIIAANGQIQYTIPHGAPSLPASATVTPGNLDSGGIQYIDVDATYIYVNLSISQVAGIALKFFWRIDL